jgi:hypothetical protein
MSLVEFLLFVYPICCMARCEPFRGDQNTKRAEKLAVPQWRPLPRGSNHLYLFGKGICHQC